MAGAVRRRAAHAAAGLELDRREAFASQLGAAASNTYIGTPVLPLGLYPPSARKVLRDYRATFGAEAGPYALYGYEAMTLVLNAVAASGGVATIVRR